MAEVEEQSENSSEDCFDEHKQDSIKLDDQFSAADTVLSTPQVEEISEAEGKGW